MSWNREQILQNRQATVDQWLTDQSSQTPADLIKMLTDRIVSLETALYPFVVTLGSLNEEGWRGTTVSSKLFPMLSDNEKFLVYQTSGEPNKAGTSVEIESPPETSLHEVEYYTEDSICIKNGKDLHDDFEVLAVHQQAPGAYVGCGAINLGDIRHAETVFYSAYPVKQS